MFVAIRVRGCVDVTPDIKRTLELLRLDRVNHMVLVDEAKKGMLSKVQFYITFGEIDAETLALAIEKRARFPGRKRLGADFLKEKGFKSFEEMAKALIEGKARLQDFGVKPVLRLNPPKKGYERAGIKKGFSVGGALGYRASDINRLVKRMI
ncbi:MAG: 50S ribosomal protein L30 [archaeon]